MNRITQALLALVCSASAVTGVVVDHLSNPLAGVNVQFAIDGSSTTTASDGGFTLTQTSSATLPPFAQFHMSVSNGLLDFTLPQAEEGSIQTFDILGHQINNLPSQSLAAGDHQYSPLGNNHQAPGVYIVQYQFGSQKGILTLAVSASQGGTVAATVTSTRALRLQAAAVIDTVRFSKTGLVTQSIAISDYAANLGQVVMDSVVAVASSSSSSTISSSSQTIQAQSITFAALGDKTYGDANFLLSATASSTLDVAFTSLTPAVCTVSGVLASIASTGVCTIQADQAGDSLFNAATSATQSFTVAPKPITVTANAQTKVYGDADPALTYVTVGLVGSDVLTGTLSRAVGEIVGTYAITGTLTNPNYAVTFTGANLVITAKPITVTANAQTKVYGDADPALTYVTVGLVGSDVLAGTLSRATGEIVGTYAISLGTLANPNYAITFVGANLVITAKPITVTASAQSKTYGDALTLGTTSYAVTSGTLVNSGDITGVTLTSAGAVGTAAAGSYTITPSAAVGSNLANYTITYATGTLTVNPRTITVTANAAGKLPGSTDPALTYTYTDTLVNGDKFTGSLIRALGEALGNYAITQGTLSLTSNYSLTYVGANFKISYNPQTCAYSSTANTLTCAEQTYQTVVIGTQTWMAQNLNYTPTSGNSWCYSNTASNCPTYGRLYDYATALTACPTGWHLPDTTAWNTLEAYVGGTATAGTALKANSTLWNTNTGTDAYGFSALPAGVCYGGSFNYVGNYGYWWTATAYGSSYAYSRGMGYDYAYVYHDYYGQSSGFSARCLKDSP